MKIKYIFRLFWGLAFFALISSANAQINVVPIDPYTAVQDVLLGEGVAAFNVQYTGSNVAMGKFTTTPLSLPFTRGIILSTGLATGASGPASTNRSTDNLTGSDPQLAGVVTAVVKDAAVLEFDFIPESDTVRFRYIFASEEYPEFVGGTFNDVFGFFISGANPSGGNYSNKNIALIPNTNTPVSINNVNDHTNMSYYVANNSSTTLAYDGRTVVLTAWARVVPCTQYHIKLAIGDVGDGIYDSGVFLEANSFTSPRVLITPTFLSDISPGNSIEGCSDAQLTIKMPFVPSYDYPLDYYLSGSATRNLDYTLNPYDPDYIIFPAGSDSVTIVIHPINDLIQEPTETILFILKTSLCFDIFDTISINIINRDSLILEVVSDTLVCNGMTANMEAQVEGGMPPLQYLWDSGVTDLTQSVLPTDSVSMYVFKVTDACDYTATDTVILVKSNVSINLRSDTIICEGGTVPLYGTGTGPLIWEGLVGETPIVSPTQQTQYIASVTNICGTASDTVIVAVDLIPYFSLGYDTIVCDQYPIQIGVPFEDGFTFLWSNGYTSNKLDINSAGEYVLNISRGVCSFSDTINIGAGFCDWWIPNSFTPDMTGFNDIFKPYGVPIYQYELIIYDRWGEVVFRSTNWSEGWDGTYKNQKVPVSIYVYQIWGETANSKMKVLLKQDRLTLIR